MAKVSIIASRLGLYKWGVFNFLSDIYEWVKEEKNGPCNTKLRGNNDTEFNVPLAPSMIRVWFSGVTDAEEVFDRFRAQRETAKRLNYLQVL